jgi:hypothetical protein
MSSGIEFDIVETYDYEEFINLVRNHLKDGWEFHGNLIAFPHMTDTDEGGRVEVLSVNYIQAFTKRTPESSLKDPSRFFPG